MSRAETAPAARHIVVGVDGSSQCQQALRWAMTLAETLHASVQAIAAWSFPPGFGTTALPDGWSPRADMEHVLIDTVKEVFGTCPDNLTMQVVEGSPSRVLRDASRSAVMVVVGSRGRGGFSELLLGSVSNALAEHAACPVLIVHGEQPALQH